MLLNPGQFCLGHGVSSMHKFMDFALIAGAVTLVHPKLGGAFIGLALLGLLDGDPGLATLTLVCRLRAQDLGIKSAVN